MVATSACRLQTPSASGSAAPDPPDSAGNTALAGPGDPLKPNGSIGPYGSPEAAPATAPPGQATAAAPPSANTPPDPALARANAGEAGVAVLDFIRLIDNTRLQVRSTAYEHGMYKVVAAPVEGEQGQERTSWVTGDHRWMASDLRDIGERSSQLEAELTFTRCLQDRTLRVFVDASSKASQQQIGALGAFGERLIVNCGDGGARCAKLGLPGYPALRWNGGEATGPQPREWFTKTLGCAAVAQPAGPLTEASSADEVAAQVLRLYELAETAPLELVSVRLDGDVYRVILLRRGQRDSFVRAVVTRSGRHLLVDPFEVARERSRIEESRRRVACLLAAKVKVFVSAQDARSIEWLASLGPAARVVALNCADPKVAKRCKDAEVRRFPTLFVDKERREGVPSRVDFEAFTGCK